MIRLITILTAVVIMVGVFANSSNVPADEAKTEKKINPKVMREPGPVIPAKAKNAPWSVTKSVDKDAKAIFDRVITKDNKGTKDIKGVIYEPVAVAVQNIGIQKYCFICISATVGDKPRFGFSAVYIVKGMGVPPRLVDIDKIDLEDD